MLRDPWARKSGNWPSDSLFGLAPFSKRKSIASKKSNFLFLVFFYGLVKKLHTNMFMLNQETVGMGKASKILPSPFLRCENPF
jgi:hypothetical protein